MEESVVGSVVFSEDKITLKYNMGDTVVFHAKSLFNPTEGTEYITYGGRTFFMK
jgi:hypothetical protein